ncbi:MAG: zinc-binding dehydrogenase, partial [Chloroflexota bacterium]|nr:zinc-binding dehydrogenase [Chloroflexota bacterium]
YDLVLDIGGNHPLRRLTRILAPGGRVVLVGPGGGQWIGPIARVVGALIRTRVGSHPVRAFLANPNREDLEYLRGLMETGELAPVIERTYPFERIPEAIAHVESGRAQGKVIAMGPTI